MNKYGALAMRHWQEWLPEHYAAIDDREEFFAGLGLEISDRIASLELDLLPPEYESVIDFMTRVGHRNMARLRAEEIVLADALPVPESDEDDELPWAWQIPTAQQTAAAVIADEAGDWPTRTGRRSRP